MKMIVEQVDDGFTRIRLDGRMDMEGTQAIDQQFAFATSTQPLRLAVDLSSVSFVISSGTASRSWRATSAARACRPLSSCRGR